MRPPEVGKPSYAALVEKIEARDNVKVLIRCYYRPEELHGGRRPYHGVKELLLSDQWNLLSADSIEGSCTVHSLEKYMELENVGPDDYFCRFEYKVSTGAFIPDRVPVYWKCDMPWNPDELMVECQLCRDWFHPRCIGLIFGEAKTLDRFVCSDCSEDLGELSISAGDCVMVRLPDTSKPFKVGRVMKIEVDRQNNRTFLVQWYCRPEEVRGGRRSDHGEKELLLSDQWDLQSADSIVGRCRVHSLDDYMEIQNVGTDGYFCRYEYRVSTGCFIPYHVHVYCKRGSPRNADELMVECEGCGDWFRPCCIRLEVEEAG